MSTTKTKTPNYNNTTTLKNTLINKPGYLTWSTWRIAQQFNTSTTVAEKAKTLARTAVTNYYGMPYNQVRKGYQY